MSQLADAVLQSLIANKSNPIYNYIIPGLTSWSLSESPEQTIRLYESEREQYQAVTPHSHRSKLECFVLSGLVSNTIWTLEEKWSTYDPWFLSTLTYNGTPGDYTKTTYEKPLIWKNVTKTYRPGESYVMEHDEIHSIYFHKGARLLLIKGPEVTKTTKILEPAAYGKHIPTFRVEPWMYKK